MISQVELEIHIAATEAFIAADATELVLTPYGRTSDGAGGFLLGEQAPRAPQTFRLIPQSDKVPEVSTSDGRMAKPEFVLLGMPDSLMERYDRFTFGGWEYEIAQVHIKPEYERKGDVVRRA